MEDNIIGHSSPAMAGYQTQRFTRKLISPEFGFAAKDLEP
jgi:hypothetical protein